MLVEALWDNSHGSEDNIKNVWRCGLDSGGSGLIPVNAFLEQSNQLCCNVKVGEFIDQLSKCSFQRRILLPEP
jgi:hypothetical protein